MTIQKLKSTRTALILVAALLASKAAHALDLRVGVGGGCTHATLTDALFALRNQAGLHTIRINKGNYPVPNGMLYTPTVAQTGVFIEGGYDSCTAPVPTGDVSSDADRAVFNGAGGDNRSVLDLRLFGLVGTFQLRRVVLTGGDATVNSPSSDEFESGGGLIVRGGASVLLGLGTSIKGNAAINGGGVALAGSLVSDTSPARKVDLFLDQGAEISNNSASNRGGGLYCGGGNPAPDLGPDGNRHGSIVLVNTIISFNQAAQGGAFYCRGSLQGGGGLQPAPSNGAAAWIVGNQGGSGLGCAAGDGTLDAALPPNPSSGLRELGAAVGQTGLLAITNNSASGNPGLCLFGSVNQGSSVAPPGQSRFLLRNLYLANQSGGGTLGLNVGAALELTVQPALDSGSCEFFGPTPCVRLSANQVSGSGGSTATGRLLSVSSSARLNLFRGRIDGNRGRPELFATTTSGILQLRASLIDANEVVVGSTPPVNSAALFDASFSGEVQVFHSTVLMATPLTWFFRIGDGIDNGSARARSSIFASTAAPAPGNVGGTAPASRFSREWCGFFQSTADFGSHSVVADPTLGSFMVLPPSALDLDPLSFAPRSAGLIDACSNSSIGNDFYGRPYTTLLEPGSAVRADIGAVEAQSLALPDPIFANGFE